MSNTVKYKQRDGKALQVIMILLACGGVMAAAYFLTLLGPTKDSETSTKETQEQRQKLNDMDKASNDLWERYSNLKAFKKTLDAADVKILEEASTMREDYIRESKKLYDPVMDQIRKELHTIKANEFRAQSLDLDMKAISAKEKGDYPTAEKLFGQAKALEDRIAAECFLSNKKDVGRIAYLDQQVRLMQARPIWEAAQGLEKEADVLYAKKDWAQAADKYKEAYDKEMILRDKYLGLLPTEYGRQTRLLRREATARSMPEYEKIEALAKAAEQLSDAGKLEEGEKKWDEALSVQENLAKLYPQSEYAGKESLDRLKNWRDRSLSASGVTHFKEGLAKLDELIRAGKSDEAGNLALSLHQEGSRLVEKFPLAVTANKTTLTKLQYIGFKSRDMALVQDKFLSLLKPVPGVDGIRMMYPEVSQILYSAIMEGGNPSASRGDTLPVESVTYDEAEEFCLRLSWLTGRVVRLPSEAEFKQAVGKIEPGLLTGQTWSIESSDGHTHPVATSKPNVGGFYDLLGNVSEWLLADEKELVAPAGGGDCQTGLEDMAKLSITRVIKKDKSRLRGFRVVVDENGKK